MKSQVQTGNAEQVAPGRDHPSGNGSGVGTPRESQTLAIEPSGPRGLADRKATGPRTELGKQTASRNSTKHGVFSKVVVLPGESQAEYEGLRAGLGEALQPEGALEELLVERLATTAWRQRRLLLAESAEIRKHSEFVESDQQNREREEAEEVARSFNPFNNHGLIDKIHNPHVLERCLELLAELREQIGKNGLNPDSDTPAFEKIYGDRGENRLREDVYDSYQIWLGTSTVSEEERVREGYASPEQCRKNIIREIDEETRRLKRYQKARSAIEVVRTQLEIQRRNVPDAPGLDRLLRYDASLERNFDRTLGQLERLQRMRLGQPVPPPINVNVSAR